jgi:RimJ/RimL family protein N-acetyltransferase
MQDARCLEYFTAYQQGEPEANARIWIEGQVQRYEEGRFGMLAVLEKDTGNYVGQCGLLHQEIEGVHELEIGYSLLSNQWGKGYATEASIFLKQWAFRHTEVDSLISIIHVDNLASKKVALRNGMQKEKTILFKGIEVDIFRLNRECLP